MVQKQISAASFLVATNMNKFVVVLYGMAALGESHTTAVLAGSVVALCRELLGPLRRASLVRLCKAPSV